SVATDERVQAYSKMVFGQTHRLAVMLGVGRSDGIVSAGELAEALGFKAQSSIQDPLRDLERSGLISRLPKVGPKVFYRRNESLAWEWAEELLRRATSGASTAVAPGSPVQGLRDGRL
ncbi:hypothetical protein N864_17545, partial [Intrasporangium chromatireducens Q5-1]